MPRKDATKPHKSDKDPKRNTVAKHAGSKHTDTTDSSQQVTSIGRAVRRMWNIVKYMLLCLLIPPFINYASIVREGEQLLGDGLLYDIGFEQKMYLRCIGSEWPTVILDAPTGHNSDVWTKVQNQLSKTTKVCAYDRAGLGLSPSPLKQNKSDVEGRTRSYNKWQEFTLERMADDVHRLFTLSSEQKKPFVYVGSELGATIARFYAHMYTQDVSDIVLVDPLVEDLFTHNDGLWQNFWYNQMIPSLQSLQFSAAIGLTRLLLLTGLMSAPLSDQGMDPDVTARQKHLYCNPRHFSAAVDEHHFINQSFSQIRTLQRIKEFPKDISVTVITGNYYDEQYPSELNKAWAKSTQHLISNLHPNSNHIVVNGADHSQLYRYPNAIIDAVRKIVRDRRYQAAHDKDLYT